jgi:hypothetical protein
LFLVGIAYTQKGETFPEIKGEVVNILSETRDYLILEVDMKIKSLKAFD